MNSAGFDPSRIVLLLIPMVLSLSLHEFAHAFVAYRLGDRTAKEQGRLTLNPLSHIDPIGTLLIPALNAITGIPFIGWARPVPVDPGRFRRGIDPRRGFALVSAAGPLANLLLAVVSAAVLAFGGAAIVGHAGLRTLFVTMIVMNVGLCVFNLLPIPPLDGSKLLPRQLDGLQRKIAPYSMFILMGLLIAPGVRQVVIGAPMTFLFTILGRLFNLG